MTKYKIICLVIMSALCNRLYAWENKETHPAITDNGIMASTTDAYLKTQMGMADGITTQLYWSFPEDIETRIDRGDANPNQTTRNISEWIRVGSIIEDEDGRRIAPWRPRHHFHDPTRNAGLDNHTDHPDWEAPFSSGWLPLGESVLVWATTGHSLYEPQNNHDKWGTARTIFYKSLKDPNETMREQYFGE